MGFGVPLSPRCHGLKLQRRKKQHGNRTRDSVPMLLCGAYYANLLMRINSPFRLFRLMSFSSSFCPFRFFIKHFAYFQRGSQLSFTFFTYYAAFATILAAYHTVQITFTHFRLSPHPSIVLKSTALLPARWRSLGGFPIADVLIFRIYVPGRSVAEHGYPGFAAVSAGIQHQIVSAVLDASHLRGVERVHENDLIGVYGAIHIII